MSFGDLFHQLIAWLTEFWPIQKISDWEQGVLVRAGKIVGPRDSTTGLFGSGFHFLIPFYYDLIVEDCKLDAGFSPRLDLITADGHPISLIITVQYSIADMAVLWGTIQNYEDSVMSTICSEVVEIALQMEKKDISTHLCTTALTSCRERLHPWGIDVSHLGIASLTSSQVLRLIGHDS